MKRHQLNALYLFIVVACYQCYSEAADCDRGIGPAGGTHCIKFANYHGHQWATCRSDAYIKTTSKNKHHCTNRLIRYCYYQCMLDEYNKESGDVLPYCSCSPSSPQPIESVKLPASCYSPNGTDCPWYTECLKKAYPRCEKSDDDYAIKYAQTFCELYNKNYDGFSFKGKQWLNALRKCLQVKLVPALDKQRSKTCKELKSRAFNSHTPCHLNPFPSSPSYCDLSSDDQLKVFWTMKSAFSQSFWPSLKSTLDIMQSCSEMSNEKREETNERVRKAKDKIEKAVDKIKQNTREKIEKIGEVKYRLQVWLENPTPVPVQLDMFIKRKDWLKFSQRGKRSITEDHHELEKSYIAGNIASQVAYVQNWQEYGLAWFAYANKETFPDADGDFISIRLLVASRFPYDLTESSWNKPANLATALTHLSEAVLKGKEIKRYDTNGIEIAKINGCLDWNCKVLAFDVTSMHENGAESHQAMYGNAFAYIVFLIITFLCSL